MLVSEKTAAHLPVCEIHPGRSLHATLKKFMTVRETSSLAIPNPSIGFFSVVVLAVVFSLYWTLFFLL